MKRLMMAGAALAALAGFATSAAASPDGWYGALDYGGHQPFDSHGTLPNGAEVGLFQHLDWDAFARVGYQFTPNWRVELEGSWREDHMKPANGFGYKGNYDDVAGMANLIYDFAPEWTVHPFIGAGIGADHEYVKERGGGGAFQITTTGQTEFAYQGLAGLSWAASDRINIDLTYRYLNGGKFNLASSAGSIHTTDWASGVSTY